MVAKKVVLTVYECEGYVTLDKYYAIIFIRRNKIN
jgi:hypothetical protein